MSAFVVSNSNIYRYLNPRCFVGVRGYLLGNRGLIQCATLQYIVSNAKQVSVRKILVKRQPPPNVPHFFFLCTFQFYFIRKLTLCATDPQFDDPNRHYFGSTVGAEFIIHRCYHLASHIG